MTHDLLVTSGADFEATPGAHQTLLTQLGWRAFHAPGPITDSNALVELIRTHGPFPRGVLAYVDAWNRDALTALKVAGGTVISRSGTGYNTVDTAACRDLGIRLCITKGANAPFIAEAALAMLYDLELKIAAIGRDLRAGQWKVNVPRQSLVGKTLAVVGYGDIGRSMAARCAGLGMNVLVWSQNWSVDREHEIERLSHGAKLLGGGTVTHFADWQSVLAAAHYVSLHMAANAETDGWFDAAKVAACKDGAILVNTGRGQLLNDEAVLAGLRSGKLRGAALDHHRQQPIPADYPYLTIPNVVCTPHQAYNTPQCVAAQLTMALRHLEMHASGSTSTVNAYVV